jgi:predicted transglutaminase-like cysteine proteinase
MLAVTMAALVALLAPALAQRSYPPLFGTREIYAPNLMMFPKWRQVMARFAEEQDACPDGGCDRDTWGKMIETLRDKDRMEQLRSVNRAMNERRYITDPVNWGVPDYWASPFQFLHKNGDCEDYAIAKFEALRAIGVPNEDMRIVILQDLNLDIAHGILVVYVGDDAWVLDNQIRSVVAADTIRHYQPVYSVNETGWWMHRP